VAVIVEITYRSSRSTSTLWPVRQVVTDNIKINTLWRRRCDVGILSRATECVLDVGMCLWASSAQPVTEIAARILIEIDDICEAAIDREITCAAGSNISDARRRPAEQVLRIKIVPSMNEARTKTDDIVHLELYRTLDVKVDGHWWTGVMICDR